MGRSFPDAPFLWGPRFLRGTRRPQRAICRGGLRPPGLAGHHPAGAESLRGQGPFLFLRKKKWFLTPRRRKVRTTPFPPCGENSVPLPCASSPHKSCAFAGPPGPVYGRLVVENGGLRLYALFGDHSRPLRPSREGTGTGCGSIRPPPARASPKAECGSALCGARRLGAPSPPCVGAARRLRVPLW